MRLTPAEVRARSMAGRMSRASCIERMAWDSAIRSTSESGMPTTAISPRTNETLMPSASRSAAVIPSASVTKAPTRPVADGALRRPSRALAAFDRPFCSIRRRWSAIRLPRSSLDSACTVDASRIRAIAVMLYFLIFYVICFF